MTRRARIRAQFSEHINAASTKFRDHETISGDSVLQWIEQFEDGDLLCGIKVLQNVRYYSAAVIRTMLRRLVQLVYESLRGVPANRIYFVPLGGPGGGGSIVARALRDTPRVTKNQIKYMADLEKLPANEVRGIVFVDDFGGTGDTFDEWWTAVEMLVRPKNARVVVAVLVLNYLARDKIEKFATYLVGVDQLTENDNVISAMSAVFNEAEKETLLAYCRRTNASPEYLRGYGACGLLVAFKHGCPNDSLPILWHNSRVWHALFRRSAI